MKTTKRALLTSVMALILCFSMLVGTTFAWFTDEVKSDVNKIVAGNLDIELEYKNVVNGQLAANWTKVQGASEIFNPDALWEPGRVEVVYLKVSNLGTLALKYQMGVNFEETPGVNMAGEELLLSKHLVFKVIKLNAEPTAAYTREEAIAEAGATMGLNSYYSETIEMPASDYDYVALIVYMPEEVGNAANYRGTAIPTINLGISLFATQLSGELAESDSFGKDYDEGAYLPVVYSAEELQSALENNESVRLGADIDLSNIEWTPIGDKDTGVYFTGTLDGNGHTISGLNVTANDYDGFISAAKDAVIKNLTVEGVVNGVNAAGIVARVEGNTVIENCVNNVTVTGSTKAGGIVCNVTGADAKIINCVNNANISGGKDGIGGIVGYVNNNAYLEIINCANNGNVTSDVNKYAGAAVGYGAKSKGVVVGFTNTGVITGTLDSANRFLKDGDTVLVGYVNTPGNWIVAATPADVQTRIDNAAAGDVITLSAGEYGTIVMKSDITLVGTEGAVVDCIKLNGSENVTLKNIEFDAAGAVLQERQGSFQFVSNIIFNNASRSSQNIVIDGCKFNGISTNLGWYAPIYTYDASLGGARVANITIINCEFNAKANQYIGLNYASDGVITVENCTFTDFYAYAITLGTSNASDLVVKGNTFHYSTRQAGAFVHSQSPASGAHMTVTVTGNTFTSDVAGSKEVTNFCAFGSKWTSANMALNCSGNTYEGDYAGMAD